MLNLSSKSQLSFNEVCDILANVGLCANDYVEREVSGDLSGGELKRIEIASVLLRHAKLTIFDEPEAGIDLWSFNNLISVFNQMQKDMSGSIVVISHQERILRIADEIILLTDGHVEKVVPKGQPLEELLTMQACRKM